LCSDWDQNPGVMCAILKIYWITATRREVYSDICGLNTSHESNTSNEALQQPNYIHVTISCPNSRPLQKATYKKHLLKKHKKVATNKHKTTLSRSI